MTKAPFLSTNGAAATRWPSVLPVALKVDGRPCVVVGGGPVGTRKVRDLLAAGALVHVVAPTVTDELRTLVTERADVTWSSRSFRDSDVESARLVLTATGHVDVDDAVYRAADARGIWVNSADDPARCTFYLTAVVRRDPVVVAVSTAGASPALASYLRRRLDDVLEEELAPLASLLADVRAELQRDGRATEQLPWSTVIDDELVASATRGEWNDVRARVRAAVGLAT